MIEEEKRSGVEPIVYFIILSVVIHAFLFYFIPKLPKPPTPKSQKPISVKFIEEQPVKGKKKPPKNPHVLGKENITVKKETRPKDQPKVEGSPRMAKPRVLPPPHPARKPATPKAKKPAVKWVQRVPKRPAPKPQGGGAKGVKPKAEKPNPPQKKEVKPGNKILATRRKGRFKVAEARPKKRVPVPRVPPKKKAANRKKEAGSEKKNGAASHPPAGQGMNPPVVPRPGSSRPPVPPKSPPLPAPNALFPSPETLHQIERKFSHTFPKNVPQGDVISLNTKSYKYISYFTHIKRKIELVWEYPQVAANLGEEGRLTLKFTILKDGRLAGVWLVQSSGYRLLDEEAIRAVREAAPFNPIPERLKKDHLNIMANFTYTLGFRFVR